jgi:hypothetical protein
MSKALFAIDSDSSEAFAHWVYESAIYLQYFKELKEKEKEKELKLLLNEYKDYKKLFIEYFGISMNDDVVIKNVIKNNEEWNECEIIQRPEQVRLGNPEMSETFKKSIDDLFNEFGTNGGEVKNNEYIVLPRQKKENYKNNDRMYDTTKLEQLFPTLHTDDVVDLNEQIRIIRISKNVIVTDGSPFIVNGMFSHDANIYIVGNTTPWQISTFPAMHYIFEKIKKQNKKVEYIEIDKRV